MLRRLTFLPVLAAAALLLSFAAAGPRVHADSLYEVDWNAVVTSEPGVELLEPFIEMPQWGPYLQMPAYVPGDLARYAAEDSGFGGFLISDPADVEIGDLGGDGVPEAILRLESGGTGGTFGVLIYQETEGWPRLLAAIPGYKIHAYFDEDRLGISEPIYFAGDGNCCPTGYERAVFVLSGDTFIEVGRSSYLLGPDLERPASMAELTVNAFYRALAVGRYQDAYEMTSAAYQEANPFEFWRDGYATTESIEVATAPGESETEIWVTLWVVDSTPGGGRVTRTFSGVWWLIPTGDGGYLLDTAAIGLVE